jgi:hypothetical protein
MTVLGKDEVQDHAYFLLRKAQVESMNVPRLGIFHVSDIIKDCMRYSAYGKESKESHMSTEDYKSLVMGQIIHAHTPLTDEEHNEMFLAWDFEKKEPLTLKEAQAIPEGDARHLDIIYGSIDDVVLLDGQYIIMDKKTTGSIDYFKRKRDKKPNDGHMKQINAYRSLLKKCYGIDAKYGCVVYIPNSISKEQRDMPHPMYFKLDEVEDTDKWMFENVATLKHFMVSGEYPDRVRNYLCDGFCPHAMKCFGTYGDSE